MATSRESISATASEIKESKWERTFKEPAATSLVVTAPIIDFKRFLLNRDERILSIHYDSCTHEYLILIDNIKSKGQQAIAILNPDTNEILRRNLAKDLDLKQVKFFSKDLIWGKGNINVEARPWHTHLILFFDRSLKPVAERLMGAGFVENLSTKDKLQIIYSHWSTSSLHLVTLIKNEKQSSFTFLRYSIPYSKIAAFPNEKIDIDKVIYLPNNELAILYRRISRLDGITTISKIRLCQVEEFGVVTKRHLDFSFPSNQSNLVCADMAFLNNKYLVIFVKDKTVMGEANLFYFSKNTQNHAWENVFATCRDIYAHYAHNLPLPFIAIEKESKRAHSTYGIYNLETACEVPDLIIDRVRDGQHLISDNLVTEDHFYYPLGDSRYIRAEALEVAEKNILHTLLAIPEIRIFPPSLLPIIAGYTPTLFKSSAEQSEPSSELKSPALRNSAFF